MSETILVSAPTSTPIVETVSAPPAAVVLPGDKPSEAVTEVPKEEPGLAKKFNALSRKEAAIRQKEASLKATETAYSQYKASIDLAKSNPLEALKAHGITLEDAIAYAINDGTKPAATPEETLKASVDEIAAKIKAYEDAQLNHQKQLKAEADRNTLSAINNEIKEYINTNSDKYELIKLNNVESEVWQIIESTYIESNGKLTLTQEQAATMLEDQLLLEAEAEAAKIEKYKNTNKYKTKHNVKKEAPVKPGITYEAVSKPDSVSKFAPTLTNNSVSVGSAETKRRLTDEESLREAAKLLKWTK